LGKRGIWSHDKRALSPIFATVLLATIIIIFGSVAYYYSTNLTTTATNSYVSTLSGSQQAISERIGFENVVYNGSSTTLTVYIINCGSANNVKINSVFLYDSSHNIVGSPYSGNSTISALNPIDRGTPTPTPLTGNCLNVGQEGYFTVTLSTTLPGPIYTIHLITQSGSYFDYEFTP
jgi:FlaG/FlaF family flagellin (archaellin)